MKIEIEISDDELREHILTAAGKASPPERSLSGGICILDQKTLL